MKGTIYINQEEEDTDKTESEVQEKTESNETSEEKYTVGTVSPYMAKFIDTYETRLKSLKDSEGVTLKVSDVLGGLARLYERVRTTVEYKGEHVLRRNAIERILKRRVWQEGNVISTIDEKKVAESLVKELIWARYLPNDTITASKLDRVSNVIGKYLYLFKNLDNIPTNLPPTKIRKWIWGVASSEIEDVLDPSNKDLYINLMYEWFTDRFKWIDKEIPDHDKEIQIYLAIHRAYTKSDESIMRYYLLLKEMPDWENAGKEEVHKLISDFPRIYIEIEKHLYFHGRFSLYRRMQKHSAAFDIFRDVARKSKLNLRKIVEDKDIFTEKIREVCEFRYGEIRRKVNTGIVRSIIYIFLTKVLFAMLIEIPYEIYFYNDVRYLPLGINIIFPPFMMWVIGMSTKIPGTKNTEAIISRLSSVVYPSEEQHRQNFSVFSAGRNTTLSTLFYLFYIVMFVLVFGSISYGLMLLNFSLSGVVVFFFFLSLVMLFAYRVRYNASQLKVESEQESLYSHVSSYLTLPFLNFGFFLSKGLSKINFLSVILDFIIEAPLKSIIDIFEEWTSYIKEKKEEIVEIPE